MTQYVGCDHARTLLEGLVDGELSMPDQLAVESHLRWCDTCARRVEDLRIIGASLRVNSAVRPVSDADNGTLSVLTDGLLVRVRAEQDASFPSRVRRLWKPARPDWDFGLRIQPFHHTVNPTLCCTNTRAAPRVSPDSSPGWVCLDSL